MSETKDRLLQLSHDIQDVCVRNNWLNKEIDRKNEYITQLEAENRRLKYEYDDSLLNRDKPLPYRWRRKAGVLYLFCPKCGMGLANWYSYCHSCGQRIKQGNPEKEMEIKDDETD